MSQRDWVVNWLSGIILLSFECQSLRHRMGLGRAQGYWLRLSTFGLLYKYNTCQSLGLSISALRPYEPSTLNSNILSCTFSPTVVSSGLLCLEGGINAPDMAVWGACSVTDLASRQPMAWRPHRSCPLRPSHGDRNRRPAETPRNIHVYKSNQLGKRCSHSAGTSSSVLCDSLDSHHGKYCHVVLRHFGHRLLRGALRGKWRKTVVGPLCRPEPFFLKLE